MSKGKVQVVPHIEKKEGRFLVAFSSPSHPKLPIRLSVSCGSNEKLAIRLVAAINAGVIVKNPTVRIDIEDEEYIDFGWAILNRQMNAELRRLGF